MYMKQKYMYKNKQESLKSVCELNYNFLCSSL